MALNQMNLEKVGGSETYSPGLIVEVKSILRAKYQLEVPESCDEFVKRCLRTKGFHKEKAASLIFQFHSSIESIKSMGVSLKPTLHSEQFYRDWCQILKTRDGRGRPICVFKPATWDPSLQSFEETIAILWMMSQNANSEFLEYQLLGCVTIWDCTGVSWKHAWATKPKALLDVLTWVQNGVLCRMKGIHIVFNPKAISAIYMMLKPLLNEKMKKRIHFHGHNLSSLHQHIESHLLPPYLRKCDQLPADDIIDDVIDSELMADFMTTDEFFAEWLKLGFPTK